MDTVGNHSVLPSEISSQDSQAALSSETQAASTSAAQAPLSSDAQAASSCDAQAAFEPCVASTSADLEAESRRDILSPTTKKTIFSWSDPATRHLLALYRDNEEDFQSGKFTKMEVWTRIAKNMRNAGYEVNGIQCDARWKYLKGKYKETRDGNKKSGNHTHSCKFYQELDDLLASKPEITPRTTCDSSKYDGMPSRSTEDNQEERAGEKRHSKDDESSEKVAKKKQKESREDAVERRHRERLARQDKFLDKMDEFLKRM